jgi:DNA-directed RNA polymerase alpha subunit
LGAAINGGAFNLNRRKRMALSNKTLVKFHQAWELLYKIQHEIPGLENIVDQLSVLEKDGFLILQVEVPTYTLQELFPRQTRIHNALLAEGVRDSNDLIKLTEQQLLRLPNVGRRVVYYVKVSLASHGLTLNEGV